MYSILSFLYIFVWAISKTDLLAEVFLKYPTDIDGIINPPVWLPLKLKRMMTERAAEAIVLALLLFFLPDFLQIDMLGR